MPHHRDVVRHRGHLRRVAHDFAVFGDTMDALRLEVAANKYSIAWLRMLETTSINGPALGPAIEALLSHVMMIELIITRRMMP